MAGSHNYTMNINIKSEASGVSKTSSELTKLRQDVQSIDGKSINLKVSIGGAAGKEITGFLKNISSMEKSLNTLSTKGIQTLQQGFSSLTKSTTDAASGVGNVQKAVDSLNGKGPTDLASGMGDIAKTSTDAASGIGQVATAADSINTGNAEELASAYADVAAEATSAASAMEKAGGSSGGSGGYPNWSNSYGGRYGGMRYTGQEVGISDLVSFIGNGKNSYELTIENAMNKTRNMAVAKSWTPEGGVTGMDAYWALDTATNNSLMSLNTLAAGINATAATTGATAKDIKTHAQDFADFGTMVLGLGYDEAVAQTAVMKLGRGLHGTFAALDQYGITEESLKLTGKWNGDENDLDGYMAAVSEYSKGMSDQLMNTTTGQVATLSKSASLGGYALGEMEAQAMGGFVRSFKFWDDKMRTGTKAMGWGAEVHDNQGRRVLEKTDAAGNTLESRYVDDKGNVYDDSGKVAYASDDKQTGEQKALQEGFKQKRTGIGLSTLIIGADQAISTYKTIKDTILSTYAEYKDLQRIAKYGLRGIFGNEDYEYDSLQGRFRKVQNSAKQTAQGPCPLSECPQNGIGGTDTGNKKKKKSRWQRFKDKFKRNKNSPTPDFYSPSIPINTEQSSGRNAPAMDSSSMKKSSKSIPSSHNINTPSFAKEKAAVNYPTPEEIQNRRIRMLESGDPTQFKLGRFLPNSDLAEMMIAEGLEPINRVEETQRQRPSDRVSRDPYTRREARRRESTSRDPYTRMQSRRDSSGGKPTNLKRASQRMKRQLYPTSQIGGTTSFLNRMDRVGNNLNSKSSRQIKRNKVGAKAPNYSNMGVANGLFSRMDEKAAKSKASKSVQKKNYANKYGGYLSRTRGAIWEGKNFKQNIKDFKQGTKDYLKNKKNIAKSKYDKGILKGNLRAEKWSKSASGAVRAMGKSLPLTFAPKNMADALREQARGTLVGDAAKRASSGLSAAKNKVTGSAAYQKASAFGSAAKGQIMGNATAFGGMIGDTRVGKAAKNSRVGKAVSNVKQQGFGKTAKSGLGRVAGGAKAVGGAALNTASKAAGGIASGIGKATGAIGGLTAGLSSVLGPIGAIIMGVTLITGLLDAMGVDWAGPLQTAFGGAFEAMQPLIQGFGQWLADTATAVGPWITKIAEGLAPILGMLGELMGSGLGALGAALAPILEGIGSIFSGGGGGNIFEGLTAGAQGLAGIIKDLKPVSEALWGAMTTGAEGMGGFLGSIFDGVGMYITHIVQEIANTIGGFIMTIATSISTGISTIYSSIITGVTGLGSAIANTFVTIATAVATSITMIYTAIATGITSIATSVTTGILMIGGAISGTITGISTAISGGIMMISGAIAMGIMGIGSSIIAVISGIYGAIAGGISALGSSVAMVISMIGMAIAMSITAIATSVAMGITTIATSIVSSIMQVTTTILNSFTTFASTVAIATASALFTVMSFQSQAVSIMGTTATDMSNAFTSNLNIQSGIEAEMSGAYSSLCYWGDMMIAKAEEIGSSISNALINIGINANSPGDIWRGIDAEFAGALGAMVYHGAHMITSAYKTGHGIVTSWDKSQQHANYNVLDGIQRSTPSTVTMPQTNLTFSSATVDSTNVAPVPIAPISSPVDLPKLTEPKLVKDVRANAVSNNEPATVVFNHYGDTDNEERANKLMKYFSHKMSFENKRANRTV